jgi:hypothetical protein
MLDQWRVGGVAVIELDDPLLAVNVEQALWSCATHRHSGRDQAPL